MEKKELLKIYSINLASFIYLYTGENPLIGEDNEGTKYFMFSVKEDTRFLINVYRKNRPSVDLKAYLGAFRKMRGLLR